MINILITGATGFVGRNVLNSISKKNVNLVIVLREENKNLINQLNCPFSLVYSKDIFAESIEWWRIQLKEVDTVIHLAWFTKHGLYINSSMNLDCLIGSINLAKGAIAAGVKRFVGVGTCFEYDLSHHILAVDTPLKPSCIYADTKAALFFSLSDLLPINNVSFAWCRLFYLFGEGEDPKRLFSYIRTKLKNGEIVDLSEGNQIRDFLDVRKAGKMICDVALGQKTGPINICSGEPKTIKQFAEEIADEYGRRDLLSFGARKNNQVDPPCVIGVK
jgi:dTDP-6-deoxy-L-talose 4-dehydrogenase (NAD+)